MGGRTDRWLERITAELRRSFAEDHTPRETAGSFAGGVFITMMPTVGTGLLVFAVLAWVSARVNRIALVASLLVVNPVVKWGVYATSFALAVAILGPVPGATPTTLSLSAGPDIIARVLLGNTILAVVVTVPSYVLCHRLVRAYRTHEIDVVEAVAEVVDPDETSLNSEADTADGTVGTTE